MVRKMQDIVPKDGRTIRNIPLPESRPRAIERHEPVKEVKKEKTVDQDEEFVQKVKLHYKKEPVVEVEDTQEPPKQFYVPEERDRDTLETSDDTIRPARKSRKGLWLALGSILGVIALAFGVSTVFHGATLTLVPRTLATPISIELSAKKTAGVGELPFQVITVKQSASETVKANGEKQVDKKASGTIIIYNNYSTASQRLIKNTRFSTPEGLIYRISDSVTVPGKKGTVPGSVEAVVTADASGESYNVGLKDFTIPGFKGDPRYTAFYARSKTPLSGGFSGIQKVIADADRAKAKTSIQSKLTADLMKLAPGQVANDQILFDKAVRIDFTQLPEEANGDSVILKEEGTLSLIVFNKEALSSSIANEQIGEYRGEPILVTNLDKLLFTPKGDFRPSVDSVSFTLSGNATFEWLYDELILKQGLAGKPRAEIPAVLSKYPMIEKADISIRPFWLRKFPTSLDRITIEKK